jgi:hypothetical protein
MLRAWKARDRYDGTRASVRTCLARPYPSHEARRLAQAPARVDEVWRIPAVLIAEWLCLGEGEGAVAGHSAL